MTLNSILLITLSLMIGWAVQAQRRRRFSFFTLTLVVSLGALVLALRS